MKAKLPWVLFLVVLLSTEFFYINMFGGYLRAYHLLTPLVILILSKYIPRIAHTSLFWCLLLFFAVNLLSAAAADVPAEAFRSLGLLAANMSISIAVALILVSARVDIRTTINIVVGVAIFSVCFGFFQLIVYYLLGLDWSLSESQGEQLIGGFASGLKTEANTFAKYLNLAFLLALPSLLTSPRWGRSLLIVAVISSGMLMSLTRSALYGLSITMLIAYLWYLTSGRGRLIAPRALIFFSVAAVGLVVFAGAVGGFNEYASHKLATFFSTKEMLTGDSAEFRLSSQALLWDAFLRTGKTLLIGNGWGQIRFMLNDREMQAGGAELVVALGYGGLLAGLSYLAYQLTAVYSAHRIVVATRSDKCAALYIGIMFGLIGLLITGQINGSILAPEYWMMFGVAIYCRYQERVISKHRRGLRRVFSTASLQ